MDLDLTFSVQENNFGVNNVIELVPSGLNIAVTELNKDEYAQVMVEYLLTKGIHEQLECLTEGLYEVIPRRYLSVFNEHELELLIAGLPNLDLSTSVACLTMSCHSLFAQMIGGRMRSIPGDIPRRVRRSRGCGATSKNRRSLNAHSSCSS